MVFAKRPHKLLTRKTFLRSKLIPSLCLLAALTPARPASAIRNGLDANTSYPSVVSVSFTDGFVGSACSAVAFRGTGIGATQTVLTSAHCLRDAIRYNLRMWVGTQEATELTVSDAFDPNDFNSPAWAILRTTNPVPASSPIASVRPYVGENMVIVGNGLTANNRLIGKRWGVATVTDYRRTTYNKMVLRSYHPTPSTNNGVCMGDQGGPALVGGKIAGLAWVAPSDCNASTESYHYDLNEERSYLNYLSNGMNSAHSTCGWAFSMYTSTASGKRKKAFFSDGQGCYDRRFGNRYFRASFAKANFDTHKSYCAGNGYSLPSPGQYALAQRPFSSGTHLPGDPNEYVWTSQQGPTPDTAIGVRLGNANDRVVFFKSVQLGSACVKSVGSGDGDFRTY